jgi:hypothetical protein
VESELTETRHSTDSPPQFVIWAARPENLPFVRALMRALHARRSRRPSKPSIATLIKRAEKTGRTVTSITTPDGTRINFGEGEPSEANNPWLADLKVTKQ